MQGDAGEDEDEDEDHHHHPQERVSKSLGTSAVLQLLLLLQVWIPIMLQDFFWILGRRRTSLQVLQTPDMAIMHAFLAHWLAGCYSKQLALRCIHPQKCMEIYMLNMGACVFFLFCWVSLSPCHHQASFLWSILSIYRLYLNDGGMYVGFLPTVPPPIACSGAWTAPARRIDEYILTSEPQSQHKVVAIGSCFFFNSLPPAFTKTRKKKTNNFFRSLRRGEEAKAVFFFFFFFYKKTV